MSQSQMRGNSTDNSTTENAVQKGQNPGGQPFTVKTTLCPLTKDYSYFRGMNLENFHRRKREGELLPFTPWRQFSQSGSTSGSYDVVLTNGYHSWYSNPHGQIEGTEWIVTEEMMPAISSQLLELQVAQAASRIYSSSGFDALTFVAELKDIKRLFHISCVGIRTLAKVPRKWKKMSSDYLSYRYGWRPLIRDLKSLYSLVENWNENSDKRHTGFSKFLYKTANTQTTQLSWSNFYVNQTIRDEVKVSLKGSVCADIVIPRLQVNPLVTAWELIPFSFVMDWFVNVGKSLYALSFLMNAEKYVAAKGYRIEYTRTYERLKGANKPGTQSASFYQLGSCTAILEERIPTHIQNFPRMSLNLDGLKILDLLSLALQRLY